MKALNLARRPFRNERLPTLILGVSLVLLGVLSVRHALAAYELRSGGARDASAELLGLQREIRALRAEADSQAVVDVPPATAKEWGAIRDLVDRRVFSWTGLFAALEAALPPGVRLISVSPTSSSGPIAIGIAAVGRSVEDALALPKALQAQGEFEDAFLNSYGESPDGVQIQCTVRYVGRRAGGAR